MSEQNQSGQHQDPAEPNRIDNAVDTSEQAPDADNSSEQVPDYAEPRPVESVPGEVPTDPGTPAKG